MPFTRIGAARTAAALILVAACGDRKDIAQDSARIAADTAPVTATTPAAGPLGTVAPADGDLMMDALEFGITDQNFATFVKASEALSFLRARDMNVRSMLEQTGTTADTSTRSLVERLEKHPQISQAINNAGMTVKDYYVMAIAIANAQRHAASPETAPPTPAGKANAEWVAKNRSQLGKLQTWGAAVAR